jgi:hypothetical protein
MAKLADPPDLGLRNHRFQSVAFHFKANVFYEWKTGFLYEIVAVANGEQNTPRSSTQTRQTSLHAIVDFRLLPTKMLQPHLARKRPSSKTTSSRGADWVFAPADFERRRG